MEVSAGGSSRVGFVAGATAAAVAVLVLLLLRVAVGGPSLPELVQEGIVQLLPGALFSTLLDQLRFAGKPLLFGSIVIGMLLFGGAIGGWYGARPRTSRPGLCLGLALLHPVRPILL